MSDGHREPGAVEIARRQPAALRKRRIPEPKGRVAVRDPSPARAQAAGQQQAGKQQEAAAPAAANPAVLTAVDLGWNMAELYAEVKPDVLQPPQAPAAPLPAVNPAARPRRVQLEQDLPGLGALGDRQKLQLLIDSVGVGFRKLEPVITHAGLAVSLPGGWAGLSYTRGSPEGRYQLARSVLQFHTELLAALTACDHQIGLAYGLGRAVADLSMRPLAGSQASLTDDLRSGRVETITGWLRELHTVLPPHSAGAVMGSITQWQQWAASPTWDGAPLDWSAHGGEVVSELAAQGKRWRLLLTGQVAPLDQLSPEDYVQAAGYLVGRVREILRRLLGQYWPWVTLFTVIMVAAVVGSLLLLHSPDAKGLGVAVSVFGWLGITGRSLSMELQRTVSHVEQSLWESELDLAAAWANTTLPDADANRQLAEPQAPRAPFEQAATRMLARRRQPPAHP